MMNIYSELFTISAIDSKLFYPDMEIADYGIDMSYRGTTADVVIDRFHAQCLEVAKKVAKDIEHYDIADILVFTALAHVLPTVIISEGGTILRFDANIGEL